jgi:hypothetical protein
MKTHHWGLALAATALALLAAGCAEDPIEQLQKDIDAPDIAVRRAAVLKLGEMKDERSVDLLVEVFQGDPDLLDMAAVQLVKKGRWTMTPEVPDPVTEAVGRTLKDLHLEENIRWRAAWVLGEIGDREALGALGAVGTDKKKRVVDEAAIAKQKLGAADPAVAYDIPPLPPADMAEQNQKPPKKEEKKPEEAKPAEPKDKVALKDVTYFPFGPKAPAL